MLGRAGLAGKTGSKPVDGDGARGVGIADPQRGRARTAGSKPASGRQNRLKAGWVGRHWDHRTPARPGRAKPTTADEDGNGCWAWAKHAPPVRNRRLPGKTG